MFIESYDCPIGTKYVTKELLKKQVITVYSNGHPVSYIPVTVCTASIYTVSFEKSRIFVGLAVLGYPEVEPIILDEVHIALGGGPDGYRGQFREITAKGVSALRVTGLRAKISEDEIQLQLALSIPRIRAVAKYRSSGTLILVQASGAGDYWGEYGKWCCISFVSTF